MQTDKKHLKVIKSLTDGKKFDNGAIPYHSGPPSKITYKAEDDDDDVPHECVVLEAMFLSHLEALFVVKASLR